MIFSDKFFESRWKVMVALLLPAILVYFKSVKYDFTTLDEQWLILKNADLAKGWIAFRDAFSKSLFGLYYRPLLVGSILLDYKMGALSPYIYHLTNLFLHLVSVLLLYKFLRLNNVSMRAAFVFSVLFSVHPVLLQAVAWVPGRNDSLLFIFSFASFISLLMYFRTPQVKLIIAHYVFFVCALFTKETAIVLPAIFIALYLVNQTGNLKRILPFFSCWLVFGLVWAFIRARIVEVDAPDHNSLFTVIKNFIPAMLLYTGKAVMPVQQSILPLMKNSSLIPGLIVTVLLIFLWFKPGVKNPKIAGLGLIIFYTMLALPVWYSASKSGAEHYEQRLYAPMAGMILFFSQLKFERFPMVARNLGIVIFCVFCLRTYSRMEIYRNRENFVDAGIKESKGNYIFLFQKSEILFDKRDFFGALDYLNQAIALRPDQGHLYGNRGTIHYQVGYFKNAISDFSKAISMSKKFDQMLYLSRAVSYEKAGDIRSAIKDLVILRSTKMEIPKVVEASITEKWNLMWNGLHQKVNSGTATAKDYFDRAQLYFDTDQQKEGLADLSKALELDPGNKEYLQQYMSKYEKRKKN